MKKIFKYTLTLLFLGGLGWSCTEDFLEVYPTEFLSAEQLEAASANKPGSSCRKFEWYLYFNV